MTTVAARTGLRNSPLKAVIYMLAAVGALTTMDAGIKWLTSDYPVPQIGFMRYAVGLVVALIFALSLGGLATLKTRRPGGHVFRSIFNLGTMLTFYYALERLPLADTIAVTYAAPLFMTVLSIVLLGERVGWRRWSAILVGFGGVLIIMQPASTDGGIDVRAMTGAVLALISAFLYALTLVTSRQMSGTERSHAILFYYSLFVLASLGGYILLAPSLLGTAPADVWRTPPWRDGWLILAVGIAGSFGQYFLNQAFRYGEVSLLAPLEYSSLVWGILLGLVIWGDFPSLLVLIGAAIIVLASFYVVRREAVLRRRRPAVMPPDAPSTPT